MPGPRSKKTGTRIGINRTFYEAKLEEWNVPVTKENLDSYREHFVKGRSEEDLGRFRSAADTYLTFLSSNPESFLAMEVLHRLGGLYIEHGLTAIDSDLETFANVLLSKMNSIEVVKVVKIKLCSLLGIINSKRGQTNDAAVHFRQAIRLEEEMSRADRDGSILFLAEQCRVGFALVSTNTRGAAILDAPCGCHVNSDLVKDVLESEIFKTKPRKCHHCKVVESPDGGTRNDEDNVKLKRCSRCLRVWYCSAKCQRIGSTTKSLVANLTTSNAGKLNGRIVQIHAGPRSCSLVNADGSHRGQARWVVKDPDDDD
ncbi:hypothetical protein HDU76_007758, partial [Blyttiomyces sp. JEL0837]